MGKIINGKDVAASVKEKIKEFVDERKKIGKSIPKIVSILVGNDGGSIYYMNSQEKVATSLGVLFQKEILDEKITEDKLIDKIKEFNNDNNIHGIMLQLPLPGHINEKKIVSVISPSKDIDGLTTESVGKLYLGEDTLIPCTPNSIMTLLKSLDIKFQGMEAVVLGRSNIVGKPVAQLLLKENATVTICHSRTKDLREVTNRADILVVAIGKPKFLDDTYIKKGAIVIDVGTSSFEGKITGDVDFDKVIDKAGYLSKVPGGVGALTTTLLIKNVCEALKLNED